MRAFASARSRSHAAIATPRSASAGRIAKRFLFLRIASPRDLHRAIFDNRGNLAQRSGNSKSRCEGGSRVPLSSELFVCRAKENFKPCRARVNGFATVWHQKGDNREQCRDQPCTSKAAGEKKSTMISCSLSRESAELIAVRRCAPLLSPLVYHDASARSLLTIHLSWLVARCSSTRSCFSSSM